MRRIRTSPNVAHALVRAVSRLFSTPVYVSGPSVGTSADAARKSACATLILLFAAASAFGAELHLTLHDEPKTLDPWLAADESAEAVQYLTEGVLIRVNRLTQQTEPELAVSWTVSKDATRITLQLREGVRFPDGSPFTSEDVIRSFERL